LKDRLLTPDLVDEFVRAFETELATLQRDALGTQVRVQRELTDVERRLRGILRAVENGAWNDSVRTRLTELEGRKAELQRQLMITQTPPPQIRLSASAADSYRSKVADSEASLNKDEIKAEAAEVLRLLIERVVLTPDAGAPDGLSAELHGELATILRLASDEKRGPRRRAAGDGPPNDKRPGTGVLGCQLSVVAGTCNHLYRTQMRWSRGQDPILICS
jgi:hypothetical protein